jgi:hypothetical protein
MDHRFLSVNRGFDRRPTGMFIRQYPRYCSDSGGRMDDSSEADLAKLYEPRRGFVTAIVCWRDYQKVVQDVVLAINQ